MCTSMHLANLWLAGSVPDTMREIRTLHLLVLEARRCNLFSVHRTFRLVMALW